MKKIIIVFFVLIALAIAGLVIFIATFDADRYRPIVIQELSKALGRPVKLKHIALGWHNGISAELQGFEIPETTGGALISLESASAHMRLMPLLKRDIQITEVVLARPQIRVSRSANGAVDLLGLAAVASPAAASRSVSQENMPAISLEIDSVRIVGGVLYWKDALAQPVPQLTVNDLNVVVASIQPGQPMDVEITAAIESDVKNFHFKGKVLPPSSGVSGWIQNGQLDIERIPIAPFMPVTGQGAPKLRAIVTTHLDLDMPSLSPSDAMERLTAQGPLNLTDVVIENLNVLRLVFDKISIIPGLVQRLQAKLPPQYLKKLDATATDFDPVALPINLSGGRLALDPLNLKTDELRFSGQGHVGILQQSVDMQARVYIEPSLSKAIIDSVNELQPLANQSGEIEVPVAIQGRAPQIAVSVDLSYLASKVAVNQVINLIDRYLSPKNEEAAEEPAASADPAASQPASPQEAAPASAEDLIGSLLRRAIEKNLPKSEEQPQ